MINTVTRSVTGVGEASVNDQVLSTKEGERDQKRYTVGRTREGPDRTFGHGSVSNGCPDWMKSSAEDCNGWNEKQMASDRAVMLRGKAVDIV